MWDKSINFMLIFNAKGFSMTVSIRIFGMRLLVKKIAKEAKSSIGTQLSSDVTTRKKMIKEKSHQNPLLY